MRKYYVINGGIYTEFELIEYELSDEVKDAVYGCTNGSLSDDIITDIIGKYHFGLDLDLDPVWLVKIN